jgi:hypothetical protein
VTSIERRFADISRRRTCKNLKTSSIQLYQSRNQDHLE